MAYSFRSCLWKNVSFLTLTANANAHIFVILFMSFWPLWKNFSMYQNAPSTFLLPVAHISNFFNPHMVIVKFYAGYFLSYPTHFWLWWTLKPNFYIIKLGFRGIYIISLISALKNRSWVLVRIFSSIRFYLQTMILAEIKKIIRIFYLKKISFLG